MASNTHHHLAPRLKKRVELYLYSTSGHSWPVLRWTVYSGGTSRLQSTSNRLNCNGISINPAAQGLTALCWTTETVKRESWQISAQNSLSKGHRFEKSGQAVHLLTGFIINIIKQPTPMYSSLTNKCTFINLKIHIKIYIKIHINIAPTCFGLRPSSGSLHWTWLKLYFRLCGSMLPHNRIINNYVISPNVLT